MRTFLSVFVGYAIFVVSALVLFRITGAVPQAQVSTAFVIISTLNGMFFAGVGGYVATVIARGNSPVPALALFAVIAVLGVIALVGKSEGTTQVLKLATVFLMSPMALLGGLLRLRQEAAKKKP
jgi:uncharacterized oligopeptide transporter (OPT) family protein